MIFNWRSIYSIL